MSNIKFIETSLERGAAKNKLLLGIPTFARTWDLPTNIKKVEFKPVRANGPGEPVNKHIGGVSIMDLTLDDFQAVCQREPRVKFPILQAASVAIWSPTYDDE